MIREAEIRDIIPIIRCLRLFSSEELDLDCSDEAFSAVRASNLLKSGITQGLLWVYEKDQEIVGFLLGGSMLNMWSDHEKEIHLITFWVSPESRKGLISGRLFLTFEKRCKELFKEDSNYKAVWVRTHLEGGFTKRSLENLGYRHLEHTYIKER